MLQDTESDELILSALSEDQDPSVFEGLYELFQNPIDLNTADAAVLAQLPAFSHQKVQAFLKYRAETGNLLSIYELQAIPEFDLTLIRKIQPYVKVKPGHFSDYPLWKRIWKEKNNYLILRHKRIWDTESDPSFPDNRNYWLIRFKTQHRNDFSLGFTAEKDAGESFQWTPNQNKYGMDHLTGHIMIQNKGLLKQLIIGDFQLHSGQGLVFGSGIFTGKTSEVVSMVQKQDVGFTPYNATAELDFFRGIASEIELKPNILIKNFVSYQLVDASLVTQDSIRWSINSFPKSGLHRTESEIAHRKSTRRWATGNIVSIRLLENRLNMGVTNSYTRYEWAINRKERLYQKFDFTGKQNFTSGVYFNYLWRNLSLFGEGALSGNFRTGLLAGLIAQLHQSVALSILFRQYDKAFHSFHGKAFSEGSHLRNESGLYLGIDCTPTPYLSIKTYFDQFNFPWLRYRVNGPSNGFEWLTQFQFNLKRNTVIKFQFKEEQKGQNTSVGQKTVIRKRSLHKYFISFHHAINKQFKLKSRIQGSHHKLSEESSQGFLIFQEITFTGEKLSLSGRFTLFDAEQYDTRQFIYEKGLWPSFSLPSYYGEGKSLYAVARYKINRKLQLASKISFTSFVRKTSDYPTPATLRKETLINTQCLYKFN